MPNPRGGVAALRRLVSRIPGRILALAAAAALVAAALLLAPRRPAPPPPGPAAPAPAPATTPVPAGALLALVIDDVGNDDPLARRLLALPVPLTLAVLPGLPHSGGYADAAARGKEVILHLPMEPEGYPAVNPGPGALTAAMDRRAILATVAADLAAVPGAVGVNNHMGSRFTAREAGMRILLTDLAGRGLFFLDSRTTAATVAIAVARETGTPAVSRNVFLDAEEESTSLAAKWNEATGLAASRGYAVAIGHLRPETVAFVEERVRAGDFRGATPVTVSTLLRRIAGAGPRA